MRISCIRRAGVPFVAALALLSAGCGDDDPTAPELADPVMVSFVELLNDHRVSVGCEPLAWRADVAGVAQAHSEDMVTKDYFSHYSLEGASPFDRLTSAGIDYSYAAENIAWGYSTGASVLDAWLNSPGHRDNIQNCDLMQHGVGLQGTHWTHVFVTP